MIAPVHPTAIESAKPRALFDAMHEGFERATQASGAPYDFDFELGGFGIRLRFASPQLASKLTRAFAHRACATTAPALTVLLWDSASTHTPLAPAVNRLVAAAQADWSGILGRRGELEDYNDERIRAGYAWSLGTLSVLDTARNLAVFWVQDAESLPTYEQAAPLKTILNWWLSEQGRQFVHGGAVGTAQGGILLAGKGGSGKTTTALACLGSPLKFAGDDYALVSLDPAPYLYSVYNSARLAPSTVRDRLPWLEARMDKSERMDEEKLVVYLAEQLPAQLCAGLPLKALIVPHVTTDADTRLQPIRPAAALSALALTTLFQLSGSGQAAFRLMANLVRALPCYQLALGSDLTQIPDVLSRVLSD